MDSPKNLFNNDPDADLRRHLDDYCPEPLPFNAPMDFTRHDNIWPPPIRQDDNFLGYDDSSGDFNFDDFFNYGEYENDVTVEEARGGGGGLHTGNPSSSGTKELGFLLVQPGNVDCSRCICVSQLSDYTNGLYNMRLTVHAVGTNIDHLVFDAEATDPEVINGAEAFYLKFEGHSVESVNAYLSNYAIQMNQDGSFVLQDSFIRIYNKLLGGDNDDDRESTPENSNEGNDGEGGRAGPDQVPQAIGNQAWVEGPGESSDNVAAEPLGPLSPNPPPRPRRLSVSEQRERTAGMTIMDLLPHFHVRAEEAARRLNICPTTLKIQCRKHKIVRWPYRKVKSIDNRIEGLERTLKEKLNQGRVEETMAIRDEIEREREKREKLYQDIVAVALS
ncbi:uncharacterized protein A4U43_C06F4640 [Asparagus officinalis]|uniref:RWP-RK domain-containing protein n=1 Tax=Asparagus officinalis TaxID=4686 RepID=A0A5P1EMX1_ASPOF|nr:uncharacterized protein LOC109844473 [Asparagus officinalis]ONK66149.1 uncharacterized protein A4U43_C06F4640 [Asparagus officinalis]